MFTTMFETRELPVSEGRNGPFKTKGATVIVNPDCVELAAINSQGNVGRGSIAFPQDPEALKAFAAQIVAVANSLEVVQRPRDEDVEEPGPQYRNCYECSCGEEWEDVWGCMCNDRCPACNTECTPSNSERLD